MQTGKYKAAILAEFLVIAILIGGYLLDRKHQTVFSDTIQIASTNTTEGKKDYIKWVDFTVPANALEYACQMDIKAYEAGTTLDWITLLAYTAAQWGGNFDSRALKQMKTAAQQALLDATEEKSATSLLEEAAAAYPYFSYYKEAYSAILSGMLGHYRMQAEDEDGQLFWKDVYGLKAYSPIASGFDYSDYDDFGSSRSYGYTRQHLGHDMMGLIGTPIIAIESGYVEVLGWNQYGGWRIGIRSFDKKRYYYYAHLRQNYPYHSSLQEGNIVTAGDVIGYMGHTGYSATENVNNIQTVHLHWGMELIFDESQKESDNEIWIDCYQLSQFLRNHRSRVAKTEDTTDWHRILDIEDPMEEAYTDQTQSQRKLPE